MKKEEYKVHPAGDAKCNKCGAYFYVGADEVGQHQCRHNGKTDWEEFFLLCDEKNVPYIAVVPIWKFFAELLEKEYERGRLDGEGWNNPCKQCGYNNH